MAKVIYNRESGEAVQCDGVDAREILATSPDLYTDEPPNAEDPDGDGFVAQPVNVANVESEFRREPVGDDPLELPREQVIIRNPVTDKPRMATDLATEPTATAAPAPSAEEAKANEAVEKPKTTAKK